jgi:hypothetical protein
VKTRGRADRLAGAIGDGSFGHPFGAAGGSIDTVDDCTIHDESHRPERAIVETGEETFDLEIRDLKCVVMRER